MSNQGSVLLIEDNDSDAYLTSHYIQSAVPTAKVDRFASAAEALRYLQREGRYNAAGKPFVIILDLMMPGEDGVWLLDKLKSVKGHKQTPVIVFSAVARDRLLERELYPNLLFSFEKPLSEQGMREALSMVGMLCQSVVEPAIPANDYETE